MVPPPKSLLSFARVPSSPPPNAATGVDLIPAAFDADPDGANEKCDMSGSHPPFEGARAPRRIPASLSGGDTLVLLCTPPLLSMPTKLRDESSGGGARSVCMLNKFRTLTGSRNEEDDPPFVFGLALAAVQRVRSGAAPVVVVPDAVVRLENPTLLCG